MRKTFLAILALMLSIGQPAAAEGRQVALVIANANYAEAEPLSNPVNDGRLVAAALRKVGFAVEVRDNLDLGGFYRALRDFRGQADGADVALIYYAGHGVQIDGQNWLIPTDAGLFASRDIPLEAIDLDRIMMTLGGAKMRVAVLDACRTDPFAKPRPNIKLVQGLARVDVDDVLLIFSAAPDHPANDGVGNNSPFATAFARRLPQPNLLLQMLGNVVRDDVIQSTQKTQRPFISASVTGEPYYLVRDPDSLVGGPVAQGSSDKLICQLTGDCANSSTSVKPASRGFSISRSGLLPKLVPRKSSLGVRTASAQRPSERWIAADPKLLMSRVEVVRTMDEHFYNFSVQGVYPGKSNGSVAIRDARKIQLFATNELRGARVPLTLPRRLKIGVWKPGSTFMMDFKLDRNLVDDNPSLELKLCIGDEMTCIFSPNFIKKIQKHLWVKK